MPSHAVPRVRAARATDVGAMRLIERVAGRLFAEIGMADVAAHEPLPAESLLIYVASGRAWVAEVDGSIAGYALADVIDGVRHLEQASVDPGHGRQGMGRLLVETVVSWARSRGFRAVTLLTFRDVPWNGPYYARLGFSPIPDSDLTPELRAMRVHERDLGLDIEARQAMRLDLR